jgi:hypothetical protein
MKHKVTQVVITGVSLALIAAASTDFFHLEYYANERNPIKEIKVTFREPTPIFNMIVDSKCENKLGGLDKFLDCMLQLKRQYKK